MDINVDIGEGFAFDAELLQIATSANVCCGEHAGSWELTLKTIALCEANGVRIGAHPGFPDRTGMGRTSPCDSDQLTNWLDSASSQTRKLANATRIAYAKPHGALYNLLNDTHQTFYEQCADWAREMSRELRVPLLLLAKTPLCEELNAIREGFADRRYLPSGLLAPRSQEDSVLRDPQAIRDQVAALSNRVDSICVHGDSPDCVKIAQLVKEVLF